MRLWPKPVVRPIRFHDLHRTTATLLLREKVLRHRDPKLTEQVYGHLADDFLRDGVDRLHFEGMPEPASVPSIAFASGSGTQPGVDAQRAGVPRRKPEDVRPF